MADRSTRTAGKPARKKRLAPVLHLVRIVVLALLVSLRHRAGGGLRHGEAA